MPGRVLRALLVGVLLLRAIPCGAAAAYAAHATDFVVNDADTDLAPLKPTGLAAGDLLLAIFGITDSRSVTLPSGWTSESNVSDLTRRIEVFSKIADATDVAATSFTFNLSAGFSTAGVILFRLTGATQTPAAIQYTTGPNDTSQTCADVTTSQNSSLVIWGLYVVTTGQTATISRGTERVDTAGAQEWLYGATEDIATAGLQSGATITSTGFGAKRLFSIAVSPSGGGAGCTPTLPLLGVGRCG